MEVISIFDIFKIGVGPSSSHTLGPWKAALNFSNSLLDVNFDKIEVRLYGSLSKTGKGHATGKAIQLGLLGYDPETIQTDQIVNILKELKSKQKITIQNNSFSFESEKHIVFTNKSKPGHPNTIKFKIYKKRKLIRETTYYSIGGGFITEKDKELAEISKKRIPFPIQNSKELKKYIEQESLSIFEIILANEVALQPKKKVKARIELLFLTIKNTILNGVINEGILPGGLNVVRRAKVLFESLSNTSIETWEDLEIVVYSKTWNFNEINQWISCFAMAVNEENAAMGRIVTAPTNGAAGVIPSVLMYYYFFCKHQFDDDIEQFFLVAGEIASLFKKGATLSAAMGGCQAEIGVSSAMAAAALTNLMGGTYEQVLMAAEIAMEHHLGLTCDPIGGLVQIPCIERNTMGAMKAITASNLALSFDPTNSKVDLDTVIKTMWDTAKSMDSRYKETAEGGLAFNISVTLPEC
ncbi:MAG: L-serine ammonia-lyase [Flavobacteriales bacterium]|nr:L-serine ammonia-lyase [Flavobacteriales bacterium]